MALVALRGEGGLWWHKLFLSIIRWPEIGFTAKIRFAAGFCWQVFGLPESPSGFGVRRFIAAFLAFGGR
jgi:hypothetical protein